MAEKFLDVKGLQCPAPIIKLSKFLKTEMQVGDILNMEATDKACASDVEAWCTKTGNNLIKSRREGDVSYIQIEKVK